ncbi:MAG: DUF6179 domain-containing protein [Ignavibacteriales bacterium]
METKLVKADAPRLDQKKLFAQEYLISLLNEAQVAGLLSEVETEDIQLQVMDVLQWMITRYNGADSSSIRVEIAERLLLSLLYCIDVYCQTIDSPEECVEILRVADMKEIYKQGQQVAKRYLTQAKELYVAVMSSRLPTNVVGYNSTLDESIPEFFSSYDVIFGTHDYTAGIDYPLAYDDSDATGIKYIYQYLFKLNMENQFCHQFAVKDIDGLLESYGSIYRIDYPEYLFNIFEIVLNNAIFAVMLGNEAQNLQITTTDFGRLRSTLSALDALEVAAILKQAAARVITELEIEDQMLKDYIAQCLKELLPRLLTAIRQDSLQNLVITTTVLESHPVIKFEHGPSMDDEDFRQMVSQVLQCDEADEKASLILSSIRSMTDFIDVLKADCLFNEDYHVVFGLLGDMELSIMVTHLFAEELRDGKTSLATILTKPFAADPDWVGRFIDFMRCLDSSRLAKIEGFSQQVE